MYVCFFVYVFMPEYKHMIGCNVVWIADVLATFAYELFYIVDININALWTRQQG